MNRRPANPKTLRAFTLIELMIVVAILGIMAMIAVPNYMKFQCRSQQSEAKAMGQTIIKQVESHPEDLNYVRFNGALTPTSRSNVPIVTIACNGTVTPGAQGNYLGLGMKGTKQRYSYVLRKVNLNSYLAQITGCAGTGVAGDQWTVTNTNITAGPGVLNNNVNACD